MKPITIATSLRSSASEFTFEDLFHTTPSSSLDADGAQQSFWNTNTPDCASNRLEACTEEDIGGELEYDEEDDIEEQGGINGKEQVRAPEPIKMSRHIGPHSFSNLAMVGKGGFGKVNQVVFKETNEIFAMKILKKKHLIQTKSVDNTIAEKDILCKIRHPFIVRLHYAFQSDTKVHLVMDFVNGGHLLHHMHKESIFSEPQAKFYIAEVILALEHLHELNIIHRDLKPENVLLDSSGHCVLTDFGFAKENVLTLESCSSFCGTLEYMAPEVVKKSKYGKPADWWSVGILLYDMLIGCPPFQHKNDNTLYKKILNDKLKLPGYLSKECVGLIKGLLQRDLKQRFTIKEIKEHKFFRNMDWEKMLRKEVRPPIVPTTRQGALDTSNFDPKLVNSKFTDSAPENSPLSRSQQLQFQGFSYVKSPANLFVPLSGPHLKL